MHFGVESAHLLVPLTVTLDQAKEQFHQATHDQIHALRLLRSQTRLLIEGCAGSGKTALAVALAKEHAAEGKSVLLTCYNRNLAQLLTRLLANTPQVSVYYFHALVETWVTAIGLSFVVPSDPNQHSEFYNEQCPELLLSASELNNRKFDTIIVDEAADFLPTWWVALESLGAQNFSWYCFYDRQQSIFHTESSWESPFSAIPLHLEANLRNTRPIGEFAAHIGNAVAPTGYRVNEGPAPFIQSSKNFKEMATQLSSLLKTLLTKDKIAVDRIVVLAPYRHTNNQSTWAAGLESTPLSTNLAQPEPGLLRIGTIQGFKGLEADIIILVGIDHQASVHPEWLYVGCSRARSLLYILTLRECLIN